ncbi:hypothetical protein B9Z19DRAFT_1124602 [Tuber borchii]|uniref:SET domain-containing protein n=1 Tax=Tuber borchii TaxID=42251 RepID=A0A2T6ZWE8_TUBBO|nr:hypothetical protein B9Z19DRAFT_1124602 [Tuber borchii]
MIKRKQEESSHLPLAHPPKPTITSLPPLPPPSIATAPTTPEPPKPYFKIIQLANEVLGAIATSTIPENTLLFSEPPLRMITHSSETRKSERVKAAFAALSGGLKALFLSLAGGTEAGVEGVWKCNNFMMTSEGLENAVFALASRINHSCDGGENAY